MRKIQFLLLWYQSYSPLLHRQGSKEDFDSSLFFIIPNMINNHSFRMKRFPFDLTH